MKKLSSLIALGLLMTQNSMNAATTQAWPPPSRDYLNMHPISTPGIKGEKSIAIEEWYENGVKHARAYEQRNADMIGLNFEDLRGNNGPVKAMTPLKTETIGQIKDFLAHQGYLRGSVNSDNIVLTLADGNIELADDTKTIADYANINHPVMIIVSGKDEPVYLEGISDDGDIIID